MNAEIEQKLSKILAKNDLLMRKQELIGQLEGIDEQLDVINLAATAPPAAAPKNKAVVPGSTA